MGTQGQGSNVIGKKDRGMTDRRKHSAHLPAGIYPHAAGTPAPPTQEVMEARMGRMANLPVGGNNAVAQPPDLQWRPPSFNSIAQQRGVPAGPPRIPKRRNNTLGEDRPTFEVWGVRFVGLLLVGVIYLEGSKISYGPTGLTWRAPPHPEIQRPPQQQE